jgi:2'-5' RNA ligase
LAAILMRLFVAIDVDDEARDAIAAEQQRLAAMLGPGGSSVAWVRRQHLHLTLVFLGRVEPGEAHAVAALMAQPIRSSGPFEIVFGGLGVFPPHGPPRVLWLGLLAGGQEVARTHRAVVERLATYARTQEERAFHSHLTLGRWRHGRPRDWRRGVDVEPAVVARTNVDEVVLYESQLSSSGPTYVPLARARLL